MDSAHQRGAASGIGHPGGPLHRIVTVIEAAAGSGHGRPAGLAVIGVSQGQRTGISTNTAGASPYGHFLAAHLAGRCVRVLLRKRIVDRSAVGVGIGVLVSRPMPLEPPTS